MDKLGDMDLFVRVVKQGGLAAAGREVGLSPARMTARMNNLEQRYGVRLLNRSTRNVSLTDEGREFYKACERILNEVEQAELSLQSGKENFSGPLRITSTVDLGQQHVAAVLSEFVKLHPEVSPYLHLSDGLVNLADEGFDLGIRYGLLADSSMVAKKLVTNRRVLCASSAYLARNGVPQTPEDLQGHDCMAFIRVNDLLTTWYFKDKAGKQQTILIKPSRATNDGVLLRQWLLQGAGITLKSELDVHNDLKEKRLVTLLDDYKLDFDAKGVSGGADLHVIYPSRHYVPKRTQGFIQALRDYFATFA
jgi:DNA-binding transcriptional LysR family regulator